MKIDKNKKVQNFEQEEQSICIVEHNQSNNGLQKQHQQSFQKSILSTNKQLNKQNLKKNGQQIDDMEYELIQPRKQKYKKFVQQNSINQKDIKDITIIVLLVLIFGVSLFRVILQVQVQYKNTQSIGQDKFNDEIFNLNSQPQNIQNYYTTHAPSQSIKITLSKQCQQQIDKISMHFGSLYQFKYPYPQLSIMSRVSSYNGYKTSGITKQQYQEGVGLLFLTHKINAQGFLKIQQSSCQDKQIKTKRLKQLMNKQKLRWNKQYKMDYYKKKQLRFCIVTNSYNNGKNGLFQRNLDSILQQDYFNYHVVYTDDSSVDRTGQLVKQYINKHKIQSKFKLILNQNKLGMMENIYNAISYHCQLGQIVIMLDGDDSFIGRNVLSIVNAVYQQEKLALLWSNFLCIFNNGHASLGFSRDYAQRQKDDNSFRKLKGFISSHLKTFFVDLFRKIKLEDLQNNNGRFYKGASDTVMMIPMLQMANPRIKYLPEILYEYRYDTGQVGNNVNKVGQKQALKKLYESKSYQKINDFQFIELALKSVLQINNEVGQKDKQSENKTEYSLNKTQQFGKKQIPIQIQKQIKR